MAWWYCRLWSLLVKHFRNLEEAEADAKIRILALLQETAQLWQLYGDAPIEQKP